MESQSWYRPRTYAHFDRPLTEDQAKRLVTSPDAVARHAFWPLILAPKRVLAGKVQPSGVRRLSEKRRPIGYCAHSDAHVFARYAAKLGERLEQEYLRVGGAHVLAYRTFPAPRCNVHFAHEAFDEMARRGDCEVIAIDVEGFFDCIDHALLKAAWASLLGVTELPDDHYRVFRACTADFAVLLPTLRDALGGEVRRRAGKGGAPICSPAAFRSLVKPHLRPRHELVWAVKGKARPQGVAEGPLGIPQGLPISAVLANLYMLKPDQDILSRVQAIGGTYRRYSDDILVIVPPGQGRHAERILAEELANVSLSVSEKKTERVRMSLVGGNLVSVALDEDYQQGRRVPIRYLGLTFDGANVRLRDSTISNFEKKARRAIQRAVVAARRGGEAKLRRRQLLARLTSLGYGNAYGQITPGERRRGVPRLGFYRYVRLAERVTGSPAISKQKRQLNALVFRWLDDADRYLAGRRASGL